MAPSFHPPGGCARAAGTTLRAAVLLAGLGWGSAGQAFEVNGFRTGMTIAEAERNAAEAGYGWEGRAGAGRAHLLAPDRSVIGTLDFCGGRLHAFQRLLGVEAEDFIRQVALEDARLGPGEYRIREQAQHSGGRDTAVRTLTFSWRDGGETVLISFVAAPGDGRIRRDWDARGTVCR